MNEQNNTEGSGPAWWYDDSIEAEPASTNPCKIEKFHIKYSIPGRDDIFIKTFEGFSEPFIQHNWYRYKFPKRLFLLGAGPSLEILYQYIMRDGDNPDFSVKDWGAWAEMRADISCRLHPYVKPKYHLRQNGNFRHNLDKYISGEKIVVSRPRGNTMAEFLQLFEEHGGEEIFLFGFDQNDEGYWRRDWNDLGDLKGAPRADGGVFTQSLKEAGITHTHDWVFTNHKVLPVLSIKIHHIGETLLNVNKIMSIEDLLDNYIGGE